MGIFDRIKDMYRANKNDDNQTVAAPSLLTMKIGDVVNIEEIDYEVFGVIHMNDHGWRWVEYKIKDGRQTFWLSVEQDDDIEISLYKEVVAITTEPTKVFEYKGDTFYMQEGSDAIVESVIGNLNLVRGETVDYYEYSTEDEDKLLSIEIWNGEVEMSVGRVIEDYNVEIYPSK